MRSKFSRRTQNTENPGLRLQKAYRFLNQGHFDRAEKTAKKLRREFPSWVDIQRISGLIALYSRKPKLAVKYFENTLSLSPDLAEHHDLLGTALMECAQYDAAKSAYQQALSISPEDPGIFGNLGNAWRKIGNLDEAIKAYEQSLKIRPNNHNVLFNLASVFHQIDDFSRAEEIYKKILALGTDDPNVYSNLSSTLLFQRKIDEALKVCERGLTIFENNLTLLFNRGHLLE